MACDTGGTLSDGDDSTNDEMTPKETTTISGTVNDGNTSKALAKSQAKTAVADATISAVAVKEDGSTVELEASTQTDSDGTYELDVERQTKGATIVVQAEKSSTDFSSSVGIQVTDTASTSAHPMTPETHAEAQVAMASNAEAGDAENPAEALADAAALVDNDVANAILSGDVAPSEISSLAQSMDQTREDYANDAGTEISGQDVAHAEQSAYENLQSALATASDSADRAEALQAFEEGMASAYEEAGASTDLQAEIEQAGTQVALSAIDASSLPDAAQRGLERRATVLRSIATGASLEDTFANSGSSEDATNAVAADRDSLVEAVRSASSLSEIETARSTFQQEVKSHMETGFNMRPADVQSGFDNLQTSLDALDQALNTAVSSTGDVNTDAVSNAFQQFYENGGSTVEGVYANQGMQQGAGSAAAKITTRIGAF